MYGEPLISHRKNSSPKVLFSCSWLTDVAFSSLESGEHRISSSGQSIQKQASCWVPFDGPKKNVSKLEESTSAAFLSSSSPQSWFRCGPGSGGNKAFLSWLTHLLVFFTIMSKQHSIPGLNFLMDFQTKLWLFYLAVDWTMSSLASGGFFEALTWTGWMEMYPFSNSAMDF